MFKFSSVSEDIREKGRGKIHYAAQFCRARYAVVNIRAPSCFCRIAEGDSLSESKKQCKRIRHTTHPRTLTRLLVINFISLITTHTYTEHKISPLHFVGRKSTHTTQNEEHEHEPLLLHYNSPFFFVTKGTTRLINIKEL